MRCFRTEWLRRVACAAALVLAAAPAGAADLPDFSSRFVGAPGPQWEGVVFGGTLGYGNFDVNFEDSTPLALRPLGGHQTTTGQQFGGFLGYNAQWDGVVLGAEGAYNRPLSMSTSQNNGLGQSAQLKLIDYATARMRAGYPVGQFLPYGFLGVAVGRFDYTVTNGGTTDSRSQAFAVGAAAGLGVDAIVLPNVFVRAEWEYNMFTKVGGMRSNTNTGRVGVGLKF